MQWQSREHNLELLKQAQYILRQWVLEQLQESGLALVGAVEYVNEFRCCCNDVTEVLVRAALATDHPSLEMAESKSNPEAGTVGSGLEAT